MGSNCPGDLDDTVPGRPSKTICLGGGLRRAKRLSD